MNPFIKNLDGTLPCDFAVVPVSLCGKCYDDLRINADKYFVTLDRCDLSGKCEVCGNDKIHICFKTRVKSKWAYMKKRGVI